MSLNDTSVVGQLLAAPQYSLPQPEKTALLSQELRQLTAHHARNCDAYRRILVAQRNGHGAESLSDLPILPARLFKHLQLQSVPDADILRVLTSSGTTSQTVSRIVLDRTTSLLQTQALAAIITAFIGPKRLPMILIDSAATLKNPRAMSARGAGLVGLSNFGRDHFYALDAEMRLDLAGLKDFIQRHQGTPILMFGFTFMVWQYFYQELRRLNETLDLNQGILIHSGGWKKLADQAVSNERFKAALRDQAGINRIHNFYGMVEQVGGVYMECEHGFLHAPNMADVLIRDPRDWTVLPPGNVGVIQTFSALPRSYPGQSLLTEDLGVIHGVDDCPCGRKGVRFNVQGRMARAELRGCSDTHAFSASSSAGLRQFVPKVTEAADIATLCPEPFFEQMPLPVLDSRIVEFLDEVSAEILKSAAGKKFPELIALAFWLRKANVRSMTADFLKTVSADESPQPVGVVFHIAPANVDTIFLYSWALALLGGNLNVVRVSQNMTPQLDVLLSLLSRVMAQERFQEIQARNVILTYAHDEQISRFLSSRADARLVWGGDETVRRLRSLPAKPTTREISFADKVSAGLVNASHYVNLSDAARAEISSAFYNDAYQFDQLACSSPHFVFFAGAPEVCEAASNLFWNDLARDVRRRQRSDVLALTVDKFVGACDYLGRDLGAEWKFGRISGEPVVLRVPAKTLPAARAKIGGGFFIESFVTDPAEIAAAVQSEDQTLSYVGYSREEMRNLAQTLCVRGVDRIVPIGRALDFRPVWDGYVLLAELTRRVTIS